MKNSFIIKQTRNRKELLRLRNTSPPNKNLQQTCYLRGTKPGWCPIATFLFNFVMEFLPRAVREEKKKKRTRVQEREGINERIEKRKKSKLSLIADDTIVHMENEKKSTDKSLPLIERV